MQFLKKHYEKVILSVVLLGLAAAAGGLWLEVGNVSQFLEDTENRLFVKATPKPFKPVNLSTNEAVVRRLAGPITFHYSDEHNLVNPVPWVKKPNGGLIKEPQRRYGPATLVVIGIQELHLNVAFDAVVGTPEKPEHHFTITNDKEMGQKRLRTITVKPNILQNEFFRVLEVRGSPEAPTEFVLMLKDGKKDEPTPITVAKDKPYVRVVGYSADLKYPPENNRIFSKKRANETLPLKGDPDTYKIESITANAVTVSASSTGKRTIVKFDGNPQANVNPQASAK